MSKTHINPKELSEDEYYSKFDADIDKLISLGVSDDDLVIYTEDYKDRFVIKKKDNTTSASEDTTLATKKGGGDFQQASEPKTLGDRFSKDEGFEFNPLQAKKDVSQSLLDEVPPGDKDLYESFSNYTELSDEDIKDVDSQLSKPKGFWDGVTEGLRDNVIVNTVLGSPEKPKTRQELISEKQRNKRIDYFNRLDDPIKRKKIENVIRVKEFDEDVNRQVQEDVVFKAFDSIKSISKEREGVLERMKSVVAEAESSSDKDSFNEKKQEYELLKISLEDIEVKAKEFKDLADTAYSEIQKSEKNIGNFKQEIDLAKRNYQSGQNALDVMGLGFERIGANLDFFLNKTDNNYNRIKTSLLDPQNEKELKAIEDRSKKIDYNAFNDREYFENKQSFLEPKKSFSEVKSVLDFAEFSVDALTETVPVLAEFSAGGVGIGLFLLENQQGNTIDIKRGVFDRKNELKDINKSLKELGGDSELETRKAQLEGFPELSPLNITLTSGAKAGLEVAFASIGKLRLLKKNARVFKSIGKSKLKEVYKKTLKKQLSEIGGGFVKDASGEAVEEYATQLFNNYVDIEFLGEKYNEDGSIKTYTQGVSGAGAGGFGVGLLLSTPIVGTKVVKEVSDKKTRSRVSKNALEVNEIYDKLKEESLSKESKTVLTDRMNTLLSENENILSSTLTNFTKLNEKENKRLNSIVSEEKALEITLNEIGGFSNVSKAIKSKLNKLDKEKGDLMNKVNFESTVSENTKDFAKDIKGVQEDISNLRQGLLAVKNNGVDIVISEKENSIVLESIKTNKESEGKGKFKEALKNITDIADSKNKTLKLTVDGSSSDKSRLIETYKKNGFDLIEGTDNMVRVPDNVNVDSVLENIKNETEKERNTKTDEGFQTRNTDDTNTGENKSVQPEVDITESSKPFELKDVKIGNKLYSIKFKDGEIVTAPKFGKAKPSKDVIKKAKEIYLNERDFSKGKLAEISEGVLEADINDIVASTSENPIEIAVALNNLIESNKSKNDNLKLTKQDAIANALTGRVISKSDHNHFTDLPIPYKMGRGKKEISLDKAREVAEQELGQEVSIDDVIGFVEDNKSISQYKSKTFTDNTTDLKIAFERVVGLKPTANNISKVIGVDNTTENTNIDSNDSSLPFQVNKVSELPISKVSELSLKSILDRLSETGLAKGVEVLSNFEIESFLSNLGVTNFNNNVQLSSKGVIITPNGFVYKDIVYINKDKATKDTPIHEFGHLWNKYISKTNPDVFRAGIDLVKGTKYHIAVLENSAYNHLSDEGKLEEALAQAIGESGAKILDNNKSKSFQVWLTNLFKKLAKTLGVRGIKDFKNVTLSQYTGLVSAELLSGKKIGFYDTSKKDIKDVDILNISSMIELQDKLESQRSSIMEKINNKNYTRKEIVSALKKYINTNLSRKSATEINKTALNKLMDIVTNADTDLKYLKAIDKIDAIVDSLNKKEYANHISKLKNRGLALKYAKSKKVNIREKRKVVGKYLKIVVSKKWLSNINFRDILTINKAIENAATTKDVLKAIDKIDAIASRLSDAYDEKQAEIEQKSRENRQKILDKKISIKKRQKHLLDFINLNLDNKNVNKLTRSKIVKLSKSLLELNTDDKLKSRLQLVDKIISEATNKHLIEKTHSILNRKVLKKVSGRLSAVNNTSLVGDIFKSIKDNLKGILDSKNNGVSVIDLSKKESLLLKAIELNEKRNLIYDKLNKGELLENSEIDELFTLNISISVIEASISSDYKKVTEILTSVNETLSDFYKTEKIKHKEAIAKRKEDRVKSKETIISSLKTKGKKPITEVEYLNFNRKQRGLLKKALNITRFFFSPTGYVVGSLDALAGLIDRSKGSVRSDGAFISFVDKMKDGMQSEKIMVLDYNKKHFNILKYVYGTTYKQDVALNKEHEITLKDGTKTYYTTSELINVYQINKNPSLRAGLDKTGFSKEVIKDIESNILTEKDMQYGDSLFELYEELYIEENEVYKERYFTDMPKSDFYAGKIFRDVNEKVSLEDIKARGSIRTTTSGSQKSRVINDKAILPQNVGYLFKRRVIEASHFINNSENLDLFSDLISDVEFKKAIVSENRNKANDIFDNLTFFEEVLANGVPRVNDKGINTILEVFARNLTKALLSINPIGMVKQTTSILSGSAEMPSSNIKHYYPSSIIDAMKYLKENSDFYRLRYDSSDMDLIQSGLESTIVSEFNIFTNTKLEASRKQISRAYGKALSYGLKNIKSGDSFGVIGVAPIFSAWVEIYTKKGFDIETSRQMAMKRFEATADRTQQTQSVFGKSRLQLSSYGRYFAMFKSTQIQNIGNISYHFNQIIRSKDNRKGSRTKNALAIVNLQLAQPMLYYYISFLMVGTIRSFFDYDDGEDAKKKRLEMKKGLITTGILGNYGAVPIFSETAIVFLDLIIANKEKSFGGRYTTPVYSAVTSLVDDIHTYNNTTNVVTTQKYEDKVIKGVMTLGFAFPEYFTEAFLERDIYTSEDVDINVKLNKLAGISNWVIDNNTNIDIDEKNILLKLNKKYGKNKKTLKFYKKKKNENK